MHCRFKYDMRPPRTAKVSRALWDALTEQFGFEPKSLGLFVSEGGFQDWLIVPTNDDWIVEIEAGLIGSGLRINAKEDAKFARQTLDNYRQIDAT